MSIRMSAAFNEAITQAALQLSEENPIARLSMPFDGFFVTHDYHGEIVATYKSHELTGKDGKDVFLKCESILGQIMSAQYI